MIILVAVGTVLVFHGKDGCRSPHRAAFLVDLGFRTLSIDLRAHGESEGSETSFGWRERLEGRYEFLRRSELRGADRNVRMGDEVRVDELRVADVAYPGMTFRFNDLERLRVPRR